MNATPRRGNLVPSHLALFEELLHFRAGQFTLANRRVTVFLPTLYDYTNVDATITHESIHKYLFEMTSSGNLLLTLAAIFEQPKLLGCMRFRKARNIYIWLLERSRALHEGVASFGEVEHARLAMGPAGANGVLGQFPDEYRTNYQRVADGLVPMCPAGLQNMTFAALLAQAALNIPIPAGLATFDAFCKTTKRRLRADLGDPEARFQRLISAIEDGSVPNAIPQLGGLDFSDHDTVKLNEAAGKFFQYVHRNLFPICGEGRITELDRIRRECLESWHADISALGFESLIDLIQFDLRASAANYTRVEYRPFFESNRACRTDSLFTPEEFEETCEQFLNHYMLQNPKFYVHLGVPRRGGVELYLDRINLGPHEIMCTLTPVDQKMGVGHPNVVPFVFKIRSDLPHKFLPIFARFKILVATTLDTEQEFKDLSLAGIHGRQQHERLERHAQMLSGQPIVYGAEPVDRPLCDLAESDLTTFHRLVHSGVDVLLSIITWLANATEVHVLPCRVQALNLPFLLFRATPSNLVPPTSRTIFFCPSDAYSIALLQDQIPKLLTGSSHPVTFHDSAGAFGISDEDLELVTTHFIYYGW